jgi:hypothetical protein
MNGVWAIYIIGGFLLLLFRLSIIVAAAYSPKLFLSIAIIWANKSY